jgi:hypothetical protein
MSWSSAMESVIRRLEIQSLKAQVVLCHRCCSSLHCQFKTESLTREQRSEISQCWVELFRESQALQQAVDLLERQDREANLALIAG